MTEETRIVEEQQATAEGPVAEAETPTAQNSATTEEASPQEQSDPGLQEVEATIDEQDTAPVEAQTEDAQDQNADASADEDDDANKNVVYLSVGQEVTGTVKRTTDFGAFVDIGAGRDGLIHISELAVGRVSKVTDVVKQGQEITAWIKKLDRSRNRISLTLISPETKTIKDLQEGEVVPGKVSKIVPYGAFIDIGVGTDALLHIREMSTGYVNKPEDVVKAGEELDVRIISVDRRRRRIDLSLKGLREEPEAEIQPETSAAVEDSDSVQQEDAFADVEVLSPMELAFKRAMEAEGVELDVKKQDRRHKRGKKRNRAIQEEIINRTLETMRE